MRDKFSFGKWIFDFSTRTVSGIAVWLVCRVVEIWL